MPGRRGAFLCAGLVVLAATLVSPARAAELDHTVRADLLKKNVNYDTGRVDYFSFMREE
ncbi:MAG: hypothetical protein ACOCWR_01560 [Oceanidesulfovibrio sp.]